MSERALEVTQAGCVVGEKNKGTVSNEALLEDLARAASAADGSVCSNCPVQRGERTGAQLVQVGLLRVLSRASIRDLVDRGLVVCITKRIG